MCQVTNTAPSNKNLEFQTQPGTDEPLHKSLKHHHSSRKRLKCFLRQSRLNFEGTMIGRRQSQNKNTRSMYVWTMCVLAECHYHTSVLIAQLWCCAALHAAPLCSFLHFAKHKIDRKHTNLSYVMGSYRYENINNPIFRIWEENNSRSNVFNRKRYQMVKRLQVDIFSGEILPV